MADNTPESTNEMTRKYVLKSVDTILYRIGLCMKANDDQPKRKSWNDPRLVMVVMIVAFVKNTINLFLPKKYLHLYVIFGEYSHFLGMRFILNTTCNLFLSLALISHLIYYYNFKHQTNPTFLNVFRVMAGELNPESIGLKSGSALRKLTRLTRMLILVTKLTNTVSVPLVCIGLMMVTFFFYFPLIQVILFGIPNLLFFILWTYQAYNIFLYQVVHFYIICKYLIIKIDRTKESAAKIISNQTFPLIKPLLQSFQAISSEINEYNASYWSKFLLIFWIGFGSNCVFDIFMLFHVQLSLWLKLIWVYITVIFCNMFLMIIFIASKVNLKMSQMYKTFNGINAMMDSAGHRVPKSRSTIRIKVCLHLCDCDYFVNIYLLS